MLQAAVLQFESARFVVSVADPEEINRAGLAMLPEVALAGRSNAGKSSTINALAGRRQLAYASKTPGRTALLNVFELLARDASGTRVPAAFLVDLPGYGFARADPALRARWDALVGGYLSTRRCLAGVVLVMDARHLLRPADETLLAFLAARPRPDRLRVHLLLNKCDQLRRAERSTALRAAEARAADLPMPTSVQLFSALQREGLDELRETIAQIVADAPGA